ncbi:hypothetical protein D515_02341 [Grimontia indica]|uniref:Uncharacterized protein n=1 Tax=Grimontia indica TaxID=1056512 RepID=R1GRW5_9GAMM|nr:MULTISPECIES: hypothetical protein [Grimontia]EOD78834.1 hypothetical protein D515_02341 [Grimontia indica]
MNYLVLIAVILLVCLAAAHSYLGERYILQRLFRRDNLPKLFGNDDFTKRTLRFAWHVTSIAWLGFAGVIIALSLPTVNVSLIATIIAITFLIHFVIALVGSKGKHLSWIAFLIVTLAVYFGVSH